MSLGAVTFGAGGGVGQNTFVGGGSIMMPGGHLSQYGGNDSSYMSQALLQQQIQRQQMLRQQHMYRQTNLVNQYRASHGPGTLDKNQIRNLFLQMVGKGAQAAGSPA